MWALQAPGAAPPGSGRSPEPAAPADSPGSSSVSSSVQPDSLQALGELGSPRESPSIQCDSLECPCCRGSLASVSGCQDSLQAPPGPGNGRGRFGEPHCNPQASSELSDSLESSGIQRDSLQSVSSLRDSFRSSSITGDSLESLASLSSGSTSQHSGLEFATN